MDRNDLRDERRLAEELTRSAFAADSVRTDPADDIERGHRALRRRRVAVSGVAVAALTIVGGGAFGVQQFGSEDGAVEAGPSDKPGGMQDPAPSPDPGRMSQQDFNRKLFEVTQRHLDPQGHSLNHASYPGFIGGTAAMTNDGTPSALGMKLGWRGPGGPSDEGMVFVTVATSRGEASVFDATGTDIEVQEQQADGEWVTIVASTTFPNNGTELEGGLPFTRDQLVELARDDELNLPEKVDVPDPYHARDPDLVPPADHGSDVPPTDQAG